MDYGMMEEQMSKVNLDWVELMPDIVKALNEAPTDALRGKAPEDIVGDEEATFEVLKMNAAKQEKAEEKFHKQVDAVEKSSKVRVLMRDSHEKGPSGPVRRLFLPTFQGMPQTVTKFETGLSEKERKDCLRIK